MSILNVFFDTCKTSETPVSDIIITVMRDNAEQLDANSVRVLLQLMYILAFGTHTKNPPDLNTSGIDFFKMIEPLLKEEREFTYTIFWDKNKPQA